jgi:hypothetical protein
MRLKRFLGEFLPSSGPSPSSVQGWNSGMEMLLKPTTTSESLNVVECGLKVVAASYSDSERGKRPITVLSEFSVSNCSKVLPSVSIEPDDGFVFKPKLTVEATLLLRFRTSF